MGCGKNQHRTNVAREFSGFVSNFDTGQPQYAYPQLRQIATKKISNRH
jgi:hypothetical protein